jgi:hypothetical protein
MKSNLSSHNRPKVEVLYDLSGWIKDCILRIEDGDDEKAARKLEKIIDTLENPVVIQNLKDIRDDLVVPF